MATTEFSGFYFRLRPQARHLLAAASKKLGKDRTAILHELIETHLAEHLEVSDRIDALMANIPVIDIQEVKA
jgi:predicted DNA-binding protein